MKKSYKIEELCCANCAAKMEHAIQKLPGVTAVSINFMTQKLNLEAEEADFDGVLKEAEKVIRRIEPDCRLVK